MSSVDKKVLFQKVVDQLEANLKILVESAFEAKEASTNEESKAENKYDTRGLEASYLASGQAQRAQGLQEQIFQLKKVNIRDFKSDDPINVSAYVELRVEEQKMKKVFLLPVGGVEIEVDGEKIQTLTLEAPLGRALHGQKLDDEFEMNGKLYEIQKVK